MVHRYVNGVIADDELNIVQPAFQQPLEQVAVRLFTLACRRFHGQNLAITRSLTPRATISKGNQQRQIAHRAVEHLGQELSRTCPRHLQLLDFADGRDGIHTVVDEVAAVRAVSFAAPRSHPLPMLRLQVLGIIMAKP